MVFFGLSNLIVPGNPVPFDLNIGPLSWNISPLNDYSQRVQRLKSESIYMATFEISNDDPDIRNQEFFHDLRSVCLCLSYLSGSAVTLQDSGFRSVCRLYRRVMVFHGNVPYQALLFSASHMQISKVT